MKRILILCEGQTEETFVTRVLDPHLKRFQKTAIPKVLVTKKVKTGLEFHGGITSYAHIRRDVQNLLQDSNAICITTMLDYYRLPADFPGKDTLHGGTPYERVAHLEQAFSANIGARRFLPYLMLHEFEALLFVDLNAVIEVLNSPITPDQFGDLRHFSSPEEINEGQRTHPAARLQQYLRGYRKPLHGPLAVERIGLPRLRQQCRHFDEWLKRLEAL